jgi:Putative prokaryotic signal transducing protein
MSDSMNSQADMNLVPLTEGGLELELSEMETLSVKTLLEANGIQVIVVGASQMPNLPYELLVPANQLEEAIRVIRDSQQGLPPDSPELA